MWTLLHNGTEKSFAEWGLVNLRRRLISQDVDEVSFEGPAATFDGDSLFGYLDTVVIKRAGVRWFEGRVTTIPRQGSGQSERISYSVAGPWLYLKRRVYQQGRKAGGPDNLATTYTSHVWLNRDDIGAPLNTGQQIAAAVNYAIAQGAQVQLSGQGLPDVEIVVDEAVDITCEEVIRKMLRWSPDAATWFDYSTSPPTLHVGRRGALQGASLDLTAGNVVTGIEITPRHDLLVPSVLLKFERTNSVDGVSWIQVVTDKAPANATGLEEGAFLATVNLQGFSASFAYVSLVCAPIRADDPNVGARFNWWQERVKPLADDRVGDLDIPLESVERETGLPNELLSGQIAPWMSFSAQAETIKARASYTTRESWPGGAVIAIKEDEAVSHKLVATNAITGQYSSLMSFDPGEPTPSGLAAQLFAAMGSLQWEGTLTLKQEEVTTPVPLGRVLNLTGGRGEWAAMNALVQQVDEHVDSGTTTVRFGPPPHLSVQDLIALLRLNRARRSFTSPSTQTSGKGIGGGKIELGERTANENSQTGESQPVRQVFKAAGFGVIDVNAFDVPAPRQLKVREVGLCIDGDDSWKMLVLGSAPYQ